MIVFGYFFKIDGLSGLQELSSDLESQSISDLAQLLNESLRRKVILHLAT